MIAYPPSGSDEKAPTQTRCKISRRITFPYLLKCRRRCCMKFVKFDAKDSRRKYVRNHGVIVSAMAPPEGVAPLFPPRPPGAPARLFCVTLHHGDLECEMNLRGGIAHIREDLAATRTELKRKEMWKMKGDVRENINLEKERYRTAHLYRETRADAELAHNMRTSIGKDVRFVDPRRTFTTHAGAC
ncbi:hypothetical protein EVAR_14467_1 [Eumeta japonica]|uniref:Uncharacterized protein n=1 Tax=Eumeta variegata TaxID=151549 RepID=A0A4C1U344_EUMVA|nr:hypothetical protein EVAR_14467_1 [Eumeta japonica]